MSPTTRHDPRSDPAGSGWTLFGFAAGLVAFVASVVFGYHGIRAEAERSARVEYTHRVLESTLTLDGWVSRMVAEQRAYLAFGDVNFAEAREEAAAEVERELAALRGLITDDPVQARRLEDFALILAERYRHVAATNRIASERGLAAAREYNAQHGRTSGLNVMLGSLDELRQEEERSLVARKEQAAAALTDLRWTLGTGAVLGVALLLGSMYSLQRQRADLARTAAMLAETEALQRAMLEAAPFIIFGTAPDGLLNTFNRAAVEQLGWRAEEVIGRERPTLFHDPDELAAFAAEMSARLGHQVASGPGLVEAFVKEGTPDDRVWTLVRRDGSRFAARIATSPVRGADSEALGAIAIAADVTLQRAAERAVAELNHHLVAKAAQLEAANQELESFSHSVSHDLRAPLRHIDGYAAMLEEDHGALLPAAARAQLHDLRGSAQRMGRLIDALLAFARLGRRSVARERVDMRALAVRAHHDLQQRDGAPATMSIGRLPDAAGDPTLLLQVWTNLLGNALKYSAPRGAEAMVEVRGEARDRFAHYSVRDNGVGFDMRYADKLFGVFQRLHGTDEFEGTGVGLATVQRIVIRHGGTIGAESQPGQGATFSFTLPLPREDG